MSNHAQLLQNSLKDQIEASESFLRVLIEERQIIAGNNIEQLPTVTEKKIALVEQLTQTEIRILTVLKEAIGEQAAEQPEAALQQLDPNNQFQLAELLSKARELANKCKDENQINGQIVNACQHQTEQTLDILLRREKSTMYSAAGKTVKRGDGSGSLGKA